MCSSKSVILSTIFILVLAVDSFAREWDYSFVDLEAKVDRPDILDIDLKLIRIRRGDYAINGTITYKKEVGPILQVFLLDL